MTVFANGLCCVQSRQVTVGRVCGIRGHGKCAWGVTGCVCVTLHRSALGIVEPRRVSVHSLCGHPPQLGCAHLSSEVCES